MVEVRSSPQRDTRPAADSSNSTPVLPDARGEALRQMEAVLKSARAAVPGTTDPLERRAEGLQTRVSQLASIPTSIAQAQELVTEIKKLESDTRATLVSQRNPWGIRASAAQESQRFNQVVTLSIPRGQALEMESHRLRGNGRVEHMKHRIQGVCSDVPTSAGRVWRQPDPSKPGYDTITIATYERHCEATRCGGIQREAFRGYLTLKQPCGGQSFNVNIHNGHNNNHLTVDTGNPTASFSAEALVTQDPSPPVRPHEDLDITPSPSDDWRAAGFESFEAYLDSFKVSKQASPETIPVTTHREPFRVVLKPGETLYVYRDSSLEGTLSYDRIKQEQNATIGLNVARARLSNELPDGAREFEIEPASSRSTQPFQFKILRLGGGPEGHGFETLAEARVEIDAPTGRFSSSSADASSGILSSADTVTTGKLETRELSEVVLPEAGSYASPSKPLVIQLGTGALQLLNVYDAGSSNVGTILSTSRDNAWDFAGGSIRIERDRSPNAPQNRLLLSAGGSVAQPQSFTLSAVSSATLEPLGRTTITVGPEVSRTRQPRDDAAPSETRYASLQASSTADVERAPAEESRPVEAAASQLASPEKREPVSFRVPRGESLYLNFEDFRERGGSTRSSYRDWEVQGNTVSTTVPGVGRISRKRGPDGDDIVTVVLEEGYNGKNPWGRAK